MVASCWPAWIHDQASCSDDPNRDGLCDKFFDKDFRIAHNCGHDGDDPQFLGNLSLTSWVNEINHEIDIEIPANCMGTAVWIGTRMLWP